MDAADGANRTRLTFTDGTEFRADWGIPARLDLDDTARGDATRVQVTGTFSCPAGEVFVVAVDLTQDATTGSGSSRGTCTGESQSVTVRITSTSGPGFVAGPADSSSRTQTGGILVGWRW